MSYGKTNRSTTGVLILVSFLAPALAAQTGCDDAGSRTSPAMPIALRLPEGATLQNWGVSQLHVTVRGLGESDEGEALLGEASFVVSEGDGPIGKLPVIPFDAASERRVVVEGLSAQGEVLARGASMPVVITAEEIPTVHVFLAPVDEFSPTIAYADGEGSPTMHYPRVGHSTTVLVDGRVLVAGGLLLEDSPVTPEQGQLLDTIEIYDPEDGRWHLASARLNLPRAYHSATLLRGRNGNLLVIGGYGVINGKLTTLALPEIIYPVRIDQGRDDGAVPLSDAAMFQPRARHTATVVDDWVLVAGGERRNEDGRTWLVPELELFFANPPEELLLPEVNACPRGRTWVFCRTPEMMLQHARVGHGATTVGSQVFLFGGSDGTRPLSSSEYFTYRRDGGTLPGATSRGPSLAQARSGMAWVNYQDQVFVLGGQGLTAQGAAKALSTIEWYSPQRPLEEQFRLMQQPELGTGRIEPSATLLGTAGWVLVAGGQSATGMPVASALLLRVGEAGLLGTSRVVGTLQEPRFGHQMVPIWNDQVLVTGGVSCTDGTTCTTLDASEVFVPSPACVE